jgi:hypothetical protein
MHFESDILSNGIKICTVQPYEFDVMQSVCNGSVPYYL